MILISKYFKKTIRFSLTNAFALESGYILMGMMIVDPYVTPI